MKKLIILWLAIFGMTIAACTTTPLDETPILSQKPMRVTFKAQQVDENGTKTIRNTDKTVSWMPSDEINIICGADKGQFTSTNTENALLASFTGELTEATVNAINNGTNDPIWALYPYDENVVSDGNSVTTTLPANQTGVADTFADDLFISLAKSNNFNLSFYNVCSGFKFSVTKAGITSITIQGKNNEDIAGKIKLSFGSDGKPKVDEVIEGQKSITLTPEKSTFEVGKDYYFVTLPIPFSSGFTVTFNTSSEIGTFEHSSSVSFPRSKFVTKPNADEGVAYKTREGIVIIPDDNFKTYCVANFDKDGDGEISTAEASIIKSINVSTNDINSLQGIEFMPNLNQLYCTGQRGSNKGKLTNLDVSHNTALQYLYCNYNQLQSLDVSHNTALQYLDCRYNELTSLDVSKNSALKGLSCEQNQLAGLDVSHNTALQDLHCQYNQLQSLDVSHNTALQFLACDNNQFQSLDVSHNTALQDLYCQYNQLQSLDVSHNTALQYLACYNNQLTSLDVSQNTALTSLRCQKNQLTSLDVSKNSALSELYCRNNAPNLEISIRRGQVLKTFGYDNTASIAETGDPIPQGNVTFADPTFKAYCVNQFDVNKDGEISYAEALLFTEIICYDQNITSLVGIEFCANVRHLHCDQNQLTSFDVSSNTALKYLSCGQNQLTTLDVSQNTALEGLSCGENKLTTLDVSNNLTLNDLSCGGNPHLAEVWLKTNQTIPNFSYDSNITTIKYK